LEEMISKLNEAIRGFANYFRIGNVKKKFKRLDECIRMMVRAYMKKKRSMKYNWRLPNKVVAQAGLVSMLGLLTNSSYYVSEIWKHTHSRKWGTDEVKAVCGKTARTV